LLTVLVVFLVCTGYLGLLGWRQVISIKNLLRDEVGDLFDGIHRAGEQARSDHQTWLDERAGRDAAYAAALIEATRPAPACRAQAGRTGRRRTIAPRLTPERGTP
jgi:hypothetical protein